MHNNSLATKRLLPRHFKIIELAVDGWNKEDIAKEVDMNLESVARLLRNPLNAQEINRRRIERGETADMIDLDERAEISRAKMLLENAAPGAAALQIQVMEDEEEKTETRLKAADNILDRVFPKEKDGSGPVLNVSISVEQANLLTLALKESTNGRNNHPAHSPSAYSS